ncbi:DUF4175 family protein [Salegentibacter chungangensis]|uniref:DUF4175 family protein n=1 Tax=Salegentibacter chungangensis TaxID=1335724 RepID=A0ABW3NNQ4_9FLAO
MGNYRIIEKKLQEFIQKYNRNKLLKGLILFAAIGLLYFILVVSLEYFLWLNRLGRSILFFLFIGVELVLFTFFIIIPLTKLFRFSKGINEEEASRIIGKHFPEVNDKLLNLLQLKKDARKSDLLLAGIEQKSAELEPVPFASAIDFKSSLKYLKFAVFPVLIIIVFVFTGNSVIFRDGVDRVVHYNKTYEPPAPFRFTIQNDKLRVRENENFKLLVRTEGELIPETASIHFNGQTYFLKSVSPGLFEYDFKRLKNKTEFQLSANGINSGIKEIDVIAVPKLLSFEIDADYPAYTGKQDEKLNGNGNFSVPEGSLITWKFNTRSTKSIKIATRDTTVTLENDFRFEKRLFSDYNYEVSTANEFIQDYENIEYLIEVVKDRYPSIDLEMKTDSIDNSTRYFKGQVSDDYGLRKLELVYYPVGEKDSLRLSEIPVSGKTFGEFLYTFPGGLQLKAGTNYEYYFRVFDNDAVNGSKASKSSVFSYREKSAEELREENLQQQRDNIGKLGESIEDYEDAEEELDEIYRLQKEKEELSYNERKKLEDFIERQKRQMEMMKNYSEKLKESFEKEKEAEEQNKLEENLKDRLEKNEERLQENEKLLEELMEFSDKINREELGKKLEELSKNNKTDKRNLEQLLELTKKYYIEEKRQKLSGDLQKLAKEQEDLSEEEEKNSPEEQERLNKEFEEFQEEMDKLEEDNERLKKPVDLDRDKIEEESIKKDQQQAREKLEESKPGEASPKQKEAAKKMRKMAGKMKQQQSMQGGEQLKADIESLRQILENLVTFSFEQEELLENFKRLDQDNPVYAKKLKQQSVLREHFRHIDDSLYSLALKNPMINEQITENLTNIEFDIEKSLERLSENLVPQGTASQQYVVTGANNLAYLLSNILSSLQQMANPQLGQGKGQEEFQLSDIIKKQESLEEEMKEGMQKQKQGQGQGEESPESEEEKGRIFEMYQKQQEIRRELDELMKKEGKDGNTDALEKAMERLEEELLEKGINEESLKRASQLKHQLLKLEEARIRQGEDTKRRSNTAEDEYSNPVNNQNIRAKEYFNSTEILNRQILPLRQNYKTKVRRYFERGNN